MGIASSNFDFIEPINCIFLAIIISIGIVVVREDAGRGKIGNRWIKLGFKGGAALYLLLFALSILGRWGGGILHNSFSYYPFSHYFHIPANFITSVLVAYFFWQARFWSAGDAKLFILFSFLLPLEYYSQGFLPYFPASALLINIFLPVSAFLSVKIIFHFLRATGHMARTQGSSGLNPRIYLPGIKNLFQANRKETFVFINTIFLTFIVLPLLKSEIVSLSPPSFKNSLTLFVAFYFLNYYFYEYTNKLSGKKLWGAFCVLSLICYAIFTQFYAWRVIFFSLKITLKAGLVFMIGMLIFKKMVDSYINEKEVTLVDINDLKPGVVLPEEIIRKIKRDKDFFPKIGDIFSDGLTQDQVDILKRSLQEGGTKSLPTYKTSSFAHWILLGVIITIVLKQSLIHFLLNHPGKLATALF